MSELKKIDRAANRSTSEWIRIGERRLNELEREIESCIGDSDKYLKLLDAQINILLNVTMLKQERRDRRITSGCLMGVVIISLFIVLAVIQWLF